MESLIHQALLEIKPCFIRPVKNIVTKIPNSPIIDPILYQYITEMFKK